MSAGYLKLQSRCVSWGSGDCSLYAMLDRIVVAEELEKSLTVALILPPLFAFRVIFDLALMSESLLKHSHLYRLWGYNGISYIAQEGRRIT